MTKETGVTCLLHVGSDTPLQVVGTDIGIDSTGGVVKLVESPQGTAFEGVKVGMTVVTSGFVAPSNNFWGVVTAAEVDEVTVTETRDPITMDPVEPVTEAAGASVTADFTEYVKMTNQQDTTFTKDATEVDVTDKDDNGWADALPGAVSMSVSLSGAQDWKNKSVWQQLTKAQDDRDKAVPCRLVLNGDGDSYYGDFAVMNQGGGGDLNSPNAFNFTLSSRGRAVYVAAAAA